MMKRKKNFYIILAIGLLVLSGCHSQRTHYGEIEATALSENMHHSFITSNQEKEYPKYYGGDYVENNRLIVLVIGDTTSRIKQDIIERSKGTNISMFLCKKQSDATRKILHELHRYRNNPQNEPLLKELRFKSCYLNSDGRVSIELLSFEENIFRNKILESPLLDFEQTIVELQ